MKTRYYIFGIMVFFAMVAVFWISAPSLFSLTAPEDKTDTSVKHGLHDVHGGPCDHEEHGNHENHDVHDVHGIHAEHPGHGRHEIHNCGNHDEHLNQDKNEAHGGCEDHKTHGNRCDHSDYENHGHGGAHCDGAASGAPCALAAPAGKGACGNGDHGRQEPARHLESKDGHDHDHAGHGGEGEICPEHGVPEENDALCHGDHLSSLQPGQGMMVRLAARDVAEKAGVTLTPPTRINRAEGTAFHGRVTFNRNQYARITPLAPGVVQRVHVQPGARVKKDAVLVEIATPEIATLKAQLAAARAKASQAGAAYEREKDLLARGITARREFEQAEADYRAGNSAVDQFRMQLLNYGLTAEDIRAFQETGNNSATVSLRSPLDGTVTELATAPGETASPGTPLLTVANLDTLWVALSVPAERIYQIRADAPVEARFKGLPGKAYQGRIFQVGAEVDPRTHTLGALAEVDNPGHRLKAGMFGRVRLFNGDPPAVLAAPRDAVQTIDGQSFIFIHQAPDLYEVRRVAVGAGEGGLIPIYSGLDPRELLVSTQGFSLKSEILKARLGASCADH